VLSRHIDNVCKVKKQDNVEKELLQVLIEQQNSLIQLLEINKNLTDKLVQQKNCAIR